MLTKKYWTHRIRDNFSRLFVDVEINTDGFLDERIHYVSIAPTIFVRCHNNQGAISRCHNFGVTILAFRDGARVRGIGEEGAVIVNVFYVDVYLRCSNHCVVKYAVDLETTFTVLFMIKNILNKKRDEVQQGVAIK